jgi:hypothetical protein
LTLIMAQTAETQRKKGHEASAKGHDAAAMSLDSGTGLCQLKRAVRVLGHRAVDRRTTVGKALAGWRDELIADLGGDMAISTQQRALVDLVVRTKLMLDSIDAWLLKQPSLVNVRKRSLLPVVRERTQLADAIARYLAALGLERRAKPVTPLHEYLASRAQQAPPSQSDSGIEAK